VKCDFDLKKKCKYPPTCQRVCDTVVQARQNVFRTSSEQLRHRKLLYRRLLSLRKWDIPRNEICNAPNTLQNITKPDQTAKEHHHAAQKTKVNDRKYALIPLATFYSSLITPHTLQQSVPSSQSAQRVVTLTSRSHESTERICSVLARNEMAVFVDMANVDLHRGMVLGGDETVCRRTFTGDVEIDYFSLVVFHDLVMLWSYQR